MSNRQKCRLFGWTASCPADEENRDPFESSKKGVIIECTKKMYDSLNTPADAHSLVTNRPSLQDIHSLWLPQSSKKGCTHISSYLLPCYPQVPIKLEILFAPSRTPTPQTLLQTATKPQSMPSFSGNSDPGVPWCPSLSLNTK